MIGSANVAARSTVVLNMDREAVYTMIPVRILISFYDWRIKKTSSSYWCIKKLSVIFFHEDRLAVLRVKNVRVVLRLIDWLVNNF